MIQLHIHVPIDQVEKYKPLYEKVKNRDPFPEDLKNSTGVRLKIDTVNLPKSIEDLFKQAIKDDLEVTLHDIPRY